VNNKRLMTLPAAGLAVALACAACGGGPNQAANTGPTTTSVPGPKTTSTPTTTEAKATTTTRPTTTAATTTTAGGPTGGSVPARFDPVSFTAVSANEFWLLGDAPCNNPYCTSIVRTTDGGSTFVGIPAPAAPLAVAGSTTATAGVDTLRFADPEDGYAFATGPGGQLWDTHDGGASWSQPSALAAQELLAFGTGNGYAFALVGSCSGGACSKMTLERSPLSTDDWTALSVPVPAGSDQVATMTVHGADVWFSVTASGQQANQLLVMGTGSGASFTTAKSPCFPGLAGTLAAASTSVLWAVCPTGMMAEAFRSDDGGAHWTTLSAGELPNSTGLAPASPTAAVLVPSAGGPLLMTTDGGKTWRNVPGTAISGDYGWSWIGFTSGRTGSALEEESAPPSNWPWPNGPFPEQLWRTSNGGSSWSGPVTI
jgi:photosystem II stability/assembly factor-like uncharacterized protein